MQDTWPIKSKNKVPFFRSYRIGAVTAYNSIRKLPTIVKILKFKSSDVNKKVDYIMLCFGEIDIRVHLIKQSEIQRRDIKDIVEQCIERYFFTIQSLIDEGFKIIIYGSIASPPKDIVVENYSSYGTTQERNNVTRLFNNYLRYKCKNSNIPFISLFEEMIDENDNTKTDLFMDDIHLSTKVLPKIFEKLHNCIEF